MQSNDLKDRRAEESSELAAIKDLLTLFLSKWRIFVLSMVVALAIAFVYMKVATPIYTRTAEILIKVDSNGGSISGLGASSELANLGIITSNTNVGNEMRTLQSLSLATEVVNLLKLNINYYALTPWRKSLLYGANNPLRVTYDQSTTIDNSSFDITPLGGGRIELSDFRWFEGDSSGEELSSDLLIEGVLGDEFITPIGSMVIESATSHPSLTFEDVIRVTHSDIYTTTKDYVERFVVALSSKDATTVVLTLEDQSPQRADDYITTLISVYNENWIKDRNQISASTDKFISERLVSIASTLGDVDDDISTFKSENMVPDIELATSIYMKESSMLDAEIMELNNQISMTKYIRDYLTSDANRDLLLPANSGVESAYIESQIASYNDLQLQRNRVVVNSSATNPIVVNFDKELSAMRAAIITAIENQMVTLQTRMASITQRDKRASQRIVDNPKQAQELLTVSRQQKVMEAIYLYLLQKREENQLTQAFTAYNTRIINLPHGDNKPTSPKAIIVVLVALVLGVLIPAIAIYVAENLVTVIRGRRDIEGLRITFLGEIPQVVSSKRRYLSGLIQRLSSKSGKTESGYLVVKPRSRNIINEAFRIARTNIEFVLKKVDGSKVIMTTSMIPGSGKTFVTLNLAASFAIKGSRVLIIDLDIRKATISSALTNATRGVTNYLSHSDDDLSSLIERGGLFPNLRVGAGDNSKGDVSYFPSLDLLPVGVIPPNPTELLMDDRLGEAFEQLRKEYDYIFVDCPPSEVVADVSIINEFADMTLYIARVGRLPKSMLQVIDRFYVDQKYKNISMILNGSSSTGGEGYGSGYGYGYGYTKSGYTVED